MAWSEYVTLTTNDRMVVLDEIAKIINRDEEVINAWMNELLGLLNTSDMRWLLSKLEKGSFPSVGLRHIRSTIMAELIVRLSSKQELIDAPVVSLRESKITEASSKVHGVINKLLPAWFLETFDESLLDDLFSLAKEEGGRIWWLRLAIEASGFVVKFAWRRFERRRSVETSGRLPAERDDEP